MFLITLVAAIVAAFLVHEAGHFLAGLCFGRVITFRFAWGSLFRIKVPRLIWDMPAGLTKRQMAIIALAGFTLEIIVTPFIYIVLNLHLYPIIVLVHFVAYPFYSGESSDFRWCSGWTEKILQYLNDKIFNGDF